MEIPRANPLPTGVTDASLGRGLATGLNQGAQMGYTMEQTRALELQNKYMPATLALKQQEMQMMMQKQQAEIQKAKSEQGLGLMKAAGEGYDRWGDDAGPELFNTFKKGVDMVAPGTIPDTWQFTPEMGGIMKQARDAVDALQTGDATLQDTMYFLSKLKAKASKVQQERLQGVLTPVQNMFDQEQTQKRTEMTQKNESERAAAQSMAPLVQQSFSVNLAKTALAKADELNDHIAINEFGKLVNNGTPIPLPELTKMAKAGTWGSKVAQIFTKVSSTGALAPEQREVLQNALDTIGESLKGQIGTRSEQFPSAKPVNFPKISAYKIGQTATFIEGNYKKVKDGPDADPTTWQKVNP
jgi:hypothetical protein